MLALLETKKILILKANFPYVRGQQKPQLQILHNTRMQEVTSASTDATRNSYFKTITIITTMKMTPTVQETKISTCQSQQQRSQNKSSATFAISYKNVMLRSTLLIASLMQKCSLRNHFLVYDYNKQTYLIFLIIISYSYSLYKYVISLFNKYTCTYMYVCTSFNRFQLYFFEIDKFYVCFSANRLYYPMFQFICTFRQFETDNWFQ